MSDKKYLKKEKKKTSRGSIPRKALLNFSTRCGMIRVRLKA